MTVAKPINPTQEQLIAMLDEIHVHITNVNGDSYGNIINHVRASFDEFNSTTTDASIIEAIEEWIARNPESSYNYEADLELYMNEKAELDELEKRVSVTRERIANHVKQHGNIKLSWVTATMSNPSVRVTYDAKLCDSLLSLLVSSGYMEFATALSDARKESTTNPYLIIKGVK
jgi:hypothetical protein